MEVLFNVRSAEGFSLDHYSIKSTEAHIKKGIYHFTTLYLE